MRPNPYGGGGGPTPVNLEVIAPATWTYVTKASAAPVNDGSHDFVPVRAGDAGARWTTTLDDVHVRVALLARPDGPWNLQVYLDELGIVCDY